MKKIIHKTVNWKALCKNMLVFPMWYGTPIGAYRWKSVNCKNCLRKKKAAK